MYLRIWYTEVWYPGNAIVSMGRGVFARFRVVPLLMFFHFVSFGNGWGGKDGGRGGEGVRDEWRVRKGYVKVDMVGCHVMRREERY